MTGWKKTLLMLLVAAFPAGIFAVRKAQSMTSAPTADAAPADATAAAVRAKAAELAALDVQIVTARGEMLKYVERRKQVLQQLEELRADITSLLTRADETEPEKAKSPAAR